MQTRKIQYLPEHVYPTDEWHLVENRYYPRLLPQMETLFSTSNGFLGMRGCHEEGNPVYQSGTFLNGFHETWPIVYGENAFGFATTGQTMVNVPDAKIIRLYVDGAAGGYVGEAFRQASPHRVSTPGVVRTPAHCCDLV